MKKLNLILIIAIVFTLALLGSQIYAQQQGGGQQGGGPQFQQRQPLTPEQIAQMTAQMETRRNQMIRDRLKLVDVDAESSNVIIEKMKPLLDLRTAQGQELRSKMDVLQKALDAKPISKTDLLTALNAVKATRAAQKIAYEAAEKDFIEVLPLAAEATLTSMGMVNSDGGGGMGFGGFRGGPGGPGGPGQDQGGQQRQRNQQGQGNQPR